MNKIVFLAVLFLLGFSACNTAPSPDKYFGVAVLNTNLINHFGTKDALSVLKNSPMAFNEKTNSMEDSNYENYVKFNISQLEKNYEAVNALPETKETKPMLNASKELFKYAIEKEKIEYVKLAKMKDAGSTDEELEIEAAKIDSLYSSEFAQKLEVLFNEAQSYARKHNLNVQWGH